MPTEDLIVGLFGHKSPLAFLIWGEPSGIAVHLGTWGFSTEDFSNDTLYKRNEIVAASLKCMYPSVELVQANGQITSPPLAGIVVGCPTPKAAEQNSGALPLDRLVRAMANCFWAVLVLAEPLDEKCLSGIRRSVIEELRRAQASQRGEGHSVVSPLAQTYTKLLEAKLASLTLALAVGGWRTATYLLGDERSYCRLASLWRGAFSGEQSVEEVVQVFSSEAACEWAAQWALPEAEGSPGPGMYRHPFAYQSLLTSHQLASYVHLPELETPGFAVSAVPQFDVVPTASSEEKINLGRVVVGTETTEACYGVPLSDLCSHAFVAGITGSGKTTTIKHLLKESSRLGAPFLVIESAKAEYRNLLSDPQLADRLQIFTLGNEQVSPFRLNPFEVVGWPDKGRHRRPDCPGCPGCLFTCGFLVFGRPDEAESARIYPVMRFDGQASDGRCEHRNPEVSSAAAGTTYRQRR